MSPSNACIASVTSDQTGKGHWCLLNRRSNTRRGDSGIDWVGKEGNTLVRANLRPAWETATFSLSHRCLPQDDGVKDRVRDDGTGAFCVRTTPGWTAVYRPRPPPQHST